MRTRFYQTSTKSSRTTLGVKRKVNRPKLSAEARAALLARRQQASQRYKNALGETWDTIDKLTEDLAVAHHKSLHRIQSELHMGHRLAHKTRKKTNAWNAFTWKKSQDKENNPSIASLTGKEVLKGLVCGAQEEYNELSKQERKELVREFEEHKATQTKAFRISTKARINDTTHTLAAIENELNNLRSRTGVETMLFTTRGTTDMPMKGVSFATSGVENFLEGVMKTDMQDFLGKMEGFAVQGIQGAAKNHKQRISSMRADIRNIINNNLREVTDDENARMEWKHYWRNVVSRYQVMIEGWPEAIPFCNLSETSNSIADLETLLRKWRCGKTYWKKLTSTELKELDRERDEQIERGEVEPPARRRRRSDFGKTRARSNMATRTKKKRRTSAREISDTERSDEESTMAPNTATRTKKKRRTSRRKVSDAEESDEGNEVAKENGTDGNSPDGPEAPAAQSPSQPLGAPLSPSSAQQASAEPVV